jgi:Protein of unknown function (DUF3320)
LAESAFHDELNDDLEEKKSATGTDVEKVPSSPVQKLTNGVEARESRKEKQSDQSAQVLDGGRFYDSDYLSETKRMAELIIIQEGPVTFKRISDLIARDHGFQRTGRQISSRVWAAMKSIKNRVRTSDDHEVYWPNSDTPSPVPEFRGLEIASRVRGWKEVQLPERLGLVNKVSASSPVDLARAVADAIGYERLTETFREEIRELQILLKNLG